MANGTTRTRSRSASELRTTARRTGCSGCGAPAGGQCSCSDDHVPCGCGELNCLCRPNWIAGMVLRDEDLRRLDTYIIERFRRLNLQSFGPGVVNGLEVRCDPCGPGVVVGCGHAISPCGDDIVLCEDAYVDICALIRKCREAERNDCLPHQRPTACPDVDEQWVLAVEYVERPAGGILPLRREPSKCSCGGHGGCACGCEDGPTGWAGSSTEADRPRHAPPSCEPTLLCEDFRFRVCPPPDMPPACTTGRDTDRRDPERGAMLERMQCCVEALMEGLPEVPPIDTGDPTGGVVSRSDEWYRWFCLVKQHFLDFVSRYPAANCEAVIDLQRLACLRRSDFTSDSAYVAYWQETVERLAVILIELLFNCICSGLLPPCPEPATSTSIPLATVKVSWADGSCRVASVCNWTRLRTYSANLRNIEYWLSFLPFGRDLRQLLECLCCDLLGNIFEDDDRDPTTGDPAGIAQPGAAPIASALAATDGSDTPRSAPNARLRERLNRRLRPEAPQAGIDRLAGIARSVSRSAAPVEPLDALADLMGAQGKEDGPFGSAGRDSPAEALMLNSLAAPILRSLVDSKGMRNFGLDLGPGKGGVSFASGAPDTDDIASLRDEVATLRARLDGLDGGTGGDGGDGNGDGGGGKGGGRGGPRKRSRKS